MKRKKVLQVLSSVMSVSLLLPMTVCADPVSQNDISARYEVITDANGNTIDLGGMEIIIRDWWSDPDRPNPNPDEYVIAQERYREWCQDTYNFTITEQAISDWGSSPYDFVDYVMSGGDDNNFVFCLRWSDATTSAFYTGLMYDLNTLELLDLNNSVFSRNRIDETWTNGDGVYAMSGRNCGYPEARSGIYFNKRLLTEAGIDPDSIYDMQAAGTWTWDAWIDMLKKVTRDTNGDGTIDVYGCSGYYDDLIYGAVMSNGGRFTKYDSNGRVQIALEDSNTLEGLNIAKTILDNYDAHLSYSIDTTWDFYKEDWYTGHYAFYYGQLWEVKNVVSEMADDIGFVSFPVGPSAGDNYHSYASDNIYVIPACYDAERADKIAFAYQLYFGDVPGYDNYLNSMQMIKKEYYSVFNDTRAVDESIDKVVRSADYEIAELVTGLQMGMDFTWQIYSNGPKISEVIVYTKEMWQPYIDAVNAERKTTGSASPAEIPGKHLSWNNVEGKSYWYENGIKQGTYDDPQGVIGDGTVRGREIYDATSNGWYWLDACYDGAKAVGKEVWMPYIYQNEGGWDEETIRSVAYESDEGMGECVLQAMLSHTGKWVRYDENGAMLKGWVTISGELAILYPDQAGNTYYYDHRTGLMAKGLVTIDGVNHYFDEISGVMQW